MANYHHHHGGGVARYGMAAAAVWREPESPQLSLMSGCSSLFSISALRDDDELLAGARSLPATPVSLAGFAGVDEVEMELRQGGGSGGDDRRTVRMMRNRESALRSRARKRVRKRIHTHARFEISWFVHMACIRQTVRMACFLECFLLLQILPCIEVLIR